jgi:hypothetical protein
MWDLIIELIRRFQSEANGDKFLLLPVGDGRNLTGTVVTYLSMGFKHFANIALGLRKGWNSFISRHGSGVGIVSYQDQR